MGEMKERTFLCFDPFVRFSGLIIDSSDTTWGVVSPLEFHIIALLKMKFAHLCSEVVGC